MKKIKWEIKDDTEPFELIMCPYCSARLNRIVYQNKINKLLPTSCHECLKSRFYPNVILVKEVIKTKKELKEKHLGC